MLPFLSNQELPYVERKLFVKFDSKIIKIVAKFFLQVRRCVLIVLQLSTNSAA